MDRALEIMGIFEHICLLLHFRDLNGMPLFIPHLATLINYQIYTWWIKRNVNIGILVDFDIFYVSNVMATSITEN